MGCLCCRECPSWAAPSNKRTVCGSLCLSWPPHSVDCYAVHLLLTWSASEVLRFFGVRPALPSPVRFVGRGGMVRNGKSMEIPVFSVDFQQLCRHYFAFSPFYAATRRPSCLAGKIFHTLSRFVVSAFGRPFVRFICFTPLCALAGFQGPPGLPPFAPGRVYALICLDICIYPAFARPLPVLPRALKYDRI